MSTSKGASRTIALVATTAAGLAGLVAVGAAPGEAATASSPYLFGAYSYGTSISGGSLPANSGKTAYALTSCTNLAGRADQNNITGVNLAGLNIGAVTSNTRTYKNGGTYNASSINKIASVVAGDATGPQLRIRALRAASRSWHSASGYHSSLTYTGNLAFTPVAGGPSVPIAFPRPGRTVDLPGLGTLTGGTKTLAKGASYASALGYSLKLHLDASDSNVRIGHTSTIIRRATPAGVLGGRAYGSEANGVGGAVTSGPTAQRVMPCGGTGGVMRRTTTAASTIPNVLGTGVTVSTVRGSTTRAGAGDAYTRSTVARVDIGGGQAVIRGIRANAHVHRTAKGTLTKDASGTTAGRITVNGVTTALPVHGKLVVPGVARIYTRRVTKSTTGVRVVAVQVTVLSGSAANTVVKLGNATASISRH